MRREETITKESESVDKISLTERIRIIKWERREEMRN